MNTENMYVVNIHLVLFNLKDPYTCKGRAELFNEISENIN